MGRWLSFSKEAICFSFFHTHSWGISTFLQKEIWEKADGGDGETRDKKKERIPQRDVRLVSWLVSQPDRLVGLIWKTSQSLPLYLSLAPMSSLFLNQTHPQDFFQTGSKCLTCMQTWRYTHTDNSWKQTAQKVWAACTPQGEGRWKLKPYAKRERERDECKEKRWRDGGGGNESSHYPAKCPSSLFTKSKPKEIRDWLWTNSVHGCVWDHMVLYMYKPFKSVRMSISMCTMDVVWMCTAKRAVSVLA